jgi:undecaprenyl-diphosphatase
MIDAILRADTAARVWLSGCHTPVLDQLMLWLSGAGSGGLLWWVAGLGVALKRPRLVGGFVQLVLAMALASLVTDAILKPLVSRMRPYERSAVEVVGNRPESRSFPSGHSANAFAGGYALARLLPGARVLIWALAAAVAYSRVYLGVHYPLDVIAGALIGLACGVLAVGGSQWNGVRSNAQPPPAIGA